MESGHDKVWWEGSVLCASVTSNMYVVHFLRLMSAPCLPPCYFSAPSPTTAELDKHHSSVSSKPLSKIQPLVEEIKMLLFLRQPPVPAGVSCLWSRNLPPSPQSLISSGLHLPSITGSVFCGKLVGKCGESVLCRWFSRWFVNTPKEMLLGNE